MTQPEATTAENTAVDMKDVDVFLSGVVLYIRIRSDSPPRRILVVTKTGRRYKASMASRTIRYAYYRITVPIKEIDDFEIERIEVLER